MSKGGRKTEVNYHVFYPTQLKKVQRPCSHLYGYMVFSQKELNRFRHIYKRPWMRAN